MVNLNFNPRLFGALKHYSWEEWWSDLSAGITVGFVALPLAMAFAIASGLKPEYGIYTAIVAGFIISAFGGSKIQIGGPAGAFIVVVYGIIVKYGVDGLLISTMMGGVFLVAMGIFRLGTLVRFVPVAIVIGFTNGIALLIALSQVKDLLGLKIDNLPSDFFPKVMALLSHLNSADGQTVILSLVSLLIIWGWTFLANRSGLKLLQRIPGSIVALIIGTAAVSFWNLPVETIGTRFGGIPSGLPSLTIPKFDVSILRGLIEPAVTIALLGAVESLLCARVADGLIEDRHDPNQELMAQGIANVVAPLMGGYCATGTIARTITNVRSGAKTPVAGIIHSVTLFSIISLAAPMAKHVPLATLGSILLFVSYNMGEWHEFVRLRHFPMNYRIILLSTFILTVVVDLTLAVEVGLALSFLFFVARMSSLTRLEPIPEVETAPHAKVGDAIEAYRVYGSLFFGAVHKLEELMDPRRPTPKFIVLSLSSLLNIDSSGLDALETLYETLHKKECRLIFSGLNGQPLSFITRAGFIDQVGQENFFETTARALEYAAQQLGQKIMPPNQMD